MRIINCMLFSVVLATCPILLACSSTYWDREWRYTGVDRDQSQKQRIYVTSSPDCDLHVDGAFVGRTPILVALSYGQSSVSLFRQQYKKPLVGAPKVIETRRKSEPFVLPTTHVLRFTDGKHHDAFITVQVPSPDTVVHADLIPQGHIKDIECLLTVQARHHPLPESSYFPLIEEILGSPEYISGRLVRLYGDQPLELPDQEDLPIEQRVFEQKYGLLVKNSILFDQMVTHLLEAAKERHFVFNIEDASFTARFTTTVAETRITHLVSGKVRAGAELFVLEPVFEPVPGAYRLVRKQTDDEGRFSFTILLRPDERYVFFISPYKDLVVVYKRLDVFSQLDEEFDKTLFLNAVGISEADFDRMWAGR